MKYTELHENKPRGTADFPIQCYRVAPDHPQYEMQLHWHREFELIRVRSGSLKVFLNNVCYHCEAGDLILVSCGVLHRGEPQQCRYDCLVFDLEMLRRGGGESIGTLLRPLIGGNSIASGILRQRDGLPFLTADSLFQAVLTDTPGRALTVYGLLYRLFGLLYAQGFITAASGRGHGRQSETVMTLLDWIEAHLSEEITLTALSNISGLSEKYLCRLFREFTNRTPIDYINHLRVENACHEMAAHHRTVTEAAFEVGFNDLSYFSRTFKKYKGMSPKDFRHSAAVRKKGK